MNSNTDDRPLPTDWVIQVFHYGTDERITGGNRLTPQDAWETVRELLEGKMALPYVEQDEWGAKEQVLEGIRCGVYGIRLCCANDGDVPFNGVVYHYGERS